MDDEETAQRKQVEERRRARQKKKIRFKFEWDNSEDTSTAADALPVMNIQKKKKARRDKYERETNFDDFASNVLTKPIKLMKARDWRIFRENYDIIFEVGKPRLLSENFGILHL